MIRITSNMGKTVGEIEGKGIDIIAELCCIVDTVLLNICGEEDNDIYNNMLVDMFKTLYKSS